MTKEVIFTHNCECFGLLPPLRDAQQNIPVALCPVCGEEQYPGDRMLRRRGRLVCARCAYQRKVMRRSGEKEENTP